jgi:hypothetical protein
VQVHEVGVDFVCFGGGDEFGGGDGGEGVGEVVDRWD